MKQTSIGKIKDFFSLSSKNKKGSLNDIVFGGAYLLKVSVTILIALFIWVSFQTAMSSSLDGSSSQSIIESVMDTLHSAYYSIDYLFPFIVGALLIVSTIFAYKSGANVLLGVISFIMWVVALVLSVLFVNVYLTISNEFPTIYAAFPVMDIIMSNLHLFTLGWLVIVTLVMFRKNNSEDVSTIDSRFYG